VAALSLVAHLTLSRLQKLQRFIRHVALAPAGVHQLGGPSHPASGSGEKNAGFLFILPSLAILVLLAWIYSAYGHLPQKPVFYTASSRL
jgi:hypothetical protein